MRRQPFVYAPTIESGPRHVTVEERRAPTDESITLYKEMEEKARASIVESTRVTGMGFDCVIHMMKLFADAETEYRAVFSVNGKKLTESVRVSNYEDNRVLAFEKLREKVAECIADELVRPAFVRTLAGATP